MCCYHLPTSIAYGVQARGSMGAGIDLEGKAQQE